MKNRVYALMRVLAHPWRSLGEARLNRRLGSRGAGARIVNPEAVTYPGCIHLGEGAQILDHARIQFYPYLTGQDCAFRVGRGSYLGSHLTVLAGADITLGEEVLLASHVLLSSENHGMDPESDIPYMNQPLTCAPVSIGDGCWLGERVTVLPGVSIGRKCVIGAGAVVTRDIPDYCVAAGVPARVIKRYDFDAHRWAPVMKV